MSNKSVSDYVAASMDAALKSGEYRQLFGTMYKSASEKCSKCGKDSCSCDSMMASDHTSQDGRSDTASADDEDMSSADDSTDESDAADSSDMVSSAFDVSIDGLLTASASLDKLGMDRASTVALKLASMVVEAKAKEKDSKKKSKSDSKSKSDKSKSKPSASSSSKKDDKKKTNPFAKKTDSKSKSDSKKSK